jgi:SPP1 gp7 family putative phage head morphogenesis protein
VNRPTQLLSSHSRARHEAAIARADSAATAVDREVLAVWRRLLALLREQDGLPVPDPFEAQARAEDLFEPMAPAVATRLRVRLRSLARWGWKSAQQGVVEALPRRGLERVFTSYLAEAEGSEEAIQPLVSLLFPAPDEDEITQLMGRGWLDQLSRATSLARPEQLAAIVGAGFAAGKTQSEIARDLLPTVDGFRTSARRVARTEGLRIAHAAQMACHEQLGDLVAGYSIHATLDARTRPAHAARDGLTWYKDEGTPMQVALKMEASTLPDAYNCRCYLSPILRPLAPAK